MELNAVLLLLFIWSLFAKKRLNEKSKSILALPYYSLHYAGGHSRIGDWKPYFEKNNIHYDVHWASETHEFLNQFMTDNWFKKYWFYHRVLWRRIKIIFLLKKYDAIWVQRAFVPFYPFKDAYFEKLINKIHDNVTVDFYDADYESNYKLTINTAKYSKKVTVASKYLVDFFLSKGITTYHVRYAMNYNEYEIVTVKNDNKIIIGWMGDPNNFSNVTYIEDELIKLEIAHPDIEFLFICRKIEGLRLKNWKQQKWGDAGFNYHEAIASFDIGIAPMIHAAEVDKARTAFKTLEYMAANVAFVTSPWGVSDKLADGQNCLFAYNKEDWSKKLLQLINNKELRNKLATSAKQTIIQYHTYGNVYKQLYNVLTDNNLR
jgi:glycosyltransferase involved in cell wall biosynthesis